LTTIPEPKKDLFSTVLGQLFSFLDSPTLVRQVSIPDLLITLNIEAMVVFFLHLGFKIREKKELALFIKELKSLIIQPDCEIIKQAISQKNDIIAGDLADLFLKNYF